MCKTLVLLSVVRVHLNLCFITYQEDLATEDVFAAFKQATLSLSSFYTWFPAKFASSTNHYPLFHCASFVNSWCCSVSILVWISGECV